MSTGIERIRLSLKEAKVPQAQYELMPSFVKAVFPKAAEGLEITTQETTQESLEKLKLGEKLGERLGEKLGERLNKNERLILEKISRNPQVTIKELSETIGISTTAVENNLKKLKDKGFARRIGPDKGGRWEVIKGESNE